METCTKINLKLIPVKNIECKKNYLAQLPRVDWHMCDCSPRSAVYLIISMVTPAQAIDKPTGYSVVNSNSALLDKHKTCVRVFWGVLKSVLCVYGLFVLVIVESESVSVTTI